MSKADILGVDEIAQIFGCSRWTAWRWLRAAEQKYGESVVGRRGRKMYTTRLALEKVAPRVIGERKQLAELQQRAQDAETRADKMASDIVSIKRKLRELSDEVKRLASLTLGLGKAPKNSSLVYLSETSQRCAPVHEVASVPHTPYKVLRTERETGSGTRGGD